MLFNGKPDQTGQDRPTPATGSDGKICERHQGGEIGLQTSLFRKRDLTTIPQIPPPG